MIILTVHCNNEDTNKYVHYKYVVILYYIFICMYLYVYMYNDINYFTRRCQLSW